MGDGSAIQRALRLLVALVCPGGPEWPWGPGGARTSPSGPVNWLLHKPLGGMGDGAVSANLWRTGWAGKRKKNWAREMNDSIGRSRLLHLLLHLSQPAEARRPSAVDLPKLPRRACPNEHSSSSRGLAAACCCSSEPAPPAGPSAAGAQWVPLAGAGVG